MKSVYKKDETRKIKTSLNIKYCLQILQNRLLNKKLLPFSGFRVRFRDFKLGKLDKPFCGVMAKQNEKKIVRRNSLHQTRRIYNTFNTFRISNTNYGIIQHGIHLSHKKSMKYSGNRLLLCELSKFNAFNLLGY